MTRRLQFNRNGIPIAPSKGREYEAVCLRKDIYRTRGDAEAYALFFRTQLGGFEQLKAYRCPTCESWHLTKRRASWIAY
jgi:hypothetical protein